MSREEIQRHREAGTCHLCDKPVLDGQATNGATGAHWDCCEKLDADIKALMGERSTEVVLGVKACGSVRAHWVNLGDYRALCGDAPKNNPRSTMGQRGKWLKFKDQNPDHQGDMCAKCVALKLAQEDF